MSEIFWKNELKKVLNSGQLKKERAHLQKISYFVDRMYLDQVKDGFIYWLDSYGWQIPQTLSPTATKKYGMSPKDIEQIIEKRAKKLLKDMEKHLNGLKKEGIEALEVEDSLEILTYPKSYVLGAPGTTASVQKAINKAGSTKKEADKLQREVRASQSRAAREIKKVWVRQAIALKKDLKKALKGYEKQEARLGDLQKANARKGYGSSFLYEHSDLTSESSNTVAASARRRELRSQRGKQPRERKVKGKKGTDVDFENYQPGAILENINPMDATQGEYASAVDDFETELFSTIDYAFGFQIEEKYDPSTGTYEDVHVITTGSRGTKKTNASAAIRKFDASKKVDQGVNATYDLIAGTVAAVLRDKYKGNSQAMLAIAASDKAGTRITNAITDQAVRGAKKHLKPGKKGKVTVKYSKTKKSDDKKYKKPNAVTKKGRSKVIRRKGAKPKKLGINSLVTTKRAATAKSRAVSSVWGHGGAAHSPIALQQLLNKALGDELQKKMTGVYPRSLEYRTGRFAQSAQVTSIVPFPRMTQIQYTYDKDPYQVFEPGSGNPLASTGRDPQRIIGGTIRELAQSIMGTKFGLVRTKRV